MDHPGHRSWADLPGEILELFLTRLYFADREHFTAVCKPWAAVAAAAKRRSPPPPIPLMLVSDSDDPDPRTWTLYSPAEGDRIHRLKLPGGSLYGSSRGWLFLDGRVPNLRDHLFNPFTKEVVLLPTGIVMGRQYKRRHFVAAALSSAPEGGCMVAALRASGGLSFCGLGDTSWMNIKDDLQVYDFLFHDGLLYYLDTLLGLTVFELDPEPKINNCLAPVLEEDDGSLNAYLVVVADKLLMVIRYYDVSNSDGIKRTVWLAVFRINPDWNDWVSVKSLDGWVLFLSRGCSVSLEASKYPAFTPNCIFFVDDHGCFLFHLEDGRIQQYHPFAPVTPEGNDSHSYFWLLHNAA